ncbi:hypothetical protein [Pseudoalteromonas aurantia]|uniref:DUF4405 domain-containing protein n=1 Tax=Pseudoalteromonas aurantia 208 TaxID=1314867 RepID=A0ABR9EII1_9GAMM|nr:hypothetical protein [Pseudoalteromonas aurantia]MBE0370793.1 hypothetical protein [Pseudoalteromonas aurantia 208]
MSFLHSRVLIGALLFFAFLVMLVTSILLFTQRHDAAISVMHTMIGVVMSGTIVWHTIKNRRILLSYLNPLKKHNGAYSLSFFLAISLVTYLSMAPYFSLSPAAMVYRFGQSLKAADKAEHGKEVIFEEYNAAIPKAQGQTVTVEFKKGPYFMWPQYALWIETLEGEFVQPLYVTRSIATNNFTNKVTKVDAEQVFDSHLMIGESPLALTALEGGEDPQTKNTRMRPESLPVFLHKLGKQASNGYFLPTDNALQVDGYSGATMMNNFIYHTQMRDRLVGQYRVRLEINHSFDYNSYYRSDRFPDDKVYSGDGYSAQPSVVYETVIDFSQPQQLQKMTIVGRGHHSGKDGILYRDLENLTTALELVDRVLISHSL